MSSVTVLFLTAIVLNLERMVELFTVINFKVRTHASE